MREGLRVSFLFYDAFDEIAKVMIASVRQHMPNAIVTQLTDLKTRKIPGVDEIRRIDGKTYGYLLGMHMISCPVPFIKLDYDMVLQGDISHILDGDHEMAFNLLGDDRILDTEYGKRYPIAASVYGAKSHRFAKALREENVKHVTDDWLGGAHNHNEVAKRFNCKLLNGHVYNYTPKHPEDKPAHALVLHYKGLRKHWMVAPEMHARAKQDEQRIVQKVKTYVAPDLLEEQHPRSVVNAK